MPGAGGIVTMSLPLPLGINGIINFKTQSRKYLRKSNINEIRWPPLFKNFRFIDIAINYIINQSESDAHVMCALWGLCFIQLQGKK